MSQPTAYTAILEHGPESFTAYVEDVAGCCVAVGATRQECEQLLREALVFHLEGLAEEGVAVPALDDLSVSFVDAE
jgi:predicted RNase H-like HicB family nuclease